MEVRMSMPELNDILADVGTFLVQSSQSEPLLKENFRKGEIITGNMQQVLDTIADDKALVERVQQTAALQAQKTIAARAAAGGVNINSAADAITTLMGDITNSHKEVDSALQVVRNKREIDPFTHPIDYVVGALTLPFAEDKLKGAVDTANLKVQQLNQVNAAVQETVKTYNSLKESTTAASVEASARIAAADARIMAYKAQLEGLKYNTEGIRVATEASKDRLAILFQSKNAENAATQLDLGLKHYKLDVEKFEFTKKEREIADEARKEEKSIDEVMVEKINLSRGSFGLEPITGLEAKSAIRMLKTGASKDLAYHYENGDRIKNTGTPFIGASPAESLDALRNIPQNLGEHTKGTIQLLQEAEAALALNKTIDKKDKKTTEQFINDHVKQSIGVQYGVITPNSGNLFDIGDLRSFKDLNGIRDLAITQKIIEPAFKSGQPLDNPKIVLGLVTKAVSNGTLTSSEATELSTIYQKGALLNQASRRFTGLGIVLPNNGKNYMVRIPGTGIVDLADPVQISRVLSKELAFQVDQEMNLKAQTRGAKNYLKRSDFQFGPELTFPGQTGPIYGR
jgi:hypothetical protein